MALTDKLTAIADAVRSKTGVTEGLTLDQMATEIEGISVGGGEELKITDASYLFNKGARLDNRELLCSAVTSSCTNFERMFSECGTHLTTVPVFDTSNGTNFSYMFHACTHLTTVPVFDTSNGKNFTYMFGSCYALTTVPVLDTSNGIDFQNMFSSCRALTTVPVFDTSNNTKFYGMFEGCSALTTAPVLDTSNGTNFGYMFNGCKELTTVPALDLNKATSITAIFQNCAEITNLYLYNIRVSITIWGSTLESKLTVDSLVHTIKELCTVTSSKTLTMGSANLEKINGLYCKITDATHEKKTMELCDSTDEGAMTLADYAMEKNWTIQ